MSDGDEGDLPGPERGKELYLDGVSEATHPVPIDVEALESAALATLEDDAADFLAGGAGGENTVSANRAAFSRWRLVPRFLRDVETRSLESTLAGSRLPAPVLLAPIGIQSLFHEEAELASARAAAAHGLPFVTSSTASTTIEDVADATADSPAWFQLYWPTDRAIAASFVDRAEAAGYEAVVLTVDAQVLPWRERDLERSFLPFLEGEGLANYLSDPAFRDRLERSPDADEAAAIREFLSVFTDPTITFDDLTWLVDRTDLPVFVKGLLHPADATAAVEAGAAGVWVSNHGGRQVDGAVPALDALPGVVRAVSEEVDIVFDSGIRRGADALKALALGADAVALGRPYVYGLAIDGENGVSAVCENFLADLDLSLGLCGQTDVRDVDREMLVRDGEVL